MRTVHRVNLLGVKISTLSLIETVDFIAESVGARGLVAISPSPVYTVMQGHERPEVRAALNSNLATPDGMPVVWALRMLGHRAERVYGPDLMLAVCERSAREGWSHFFFGGAPGVAEMLAAEMRRRFPALAVAGVLCPPFRALTSEEEEAMLAHLNGSGAQIVWVGLGSPKQDLWMAQYRPRLRPPVLVGVGAAFDFFTGRTPQAPRWMRRGGLEWLFRLASEPRRLWRRYVIYNPKFVWEVTRQRLGLRRYE